MRWETFNSMWRLDLIWGFCDYRARRQPLHSALQWWFGVLSGKWRDWIRYYYLRNRKGVSVRIGRNLTSRNKIRTLFASRKFTSHKLLSMSVSFRPILLFLKARRRERGLHWKMRKVLVRRWIAYMLGKSILTILRECNLFLSKGKTPKKVTPQDLYEVLRLTLREMRQKLGQTGPVDELIQYLFGNHLILKVRFFHWNCDLFFRSSWKSRNMSIQTRTWETR